MSFFKSSRSRGKGTAGQFAQSEPTSNMSVQDTTESELPSEPVSPMTFEFSIPRDNEGEQSKSSSSTILPRVSPSSSVRSYRLEDNNDNIRYHGDRRSLVKNKENAEEKRASKSQANKGDGKKQQSLPMSSTQSGLQDADDEDARSLKDSYRGLHSSRLQKSITPLTHPKRPRFKKKGGSLLGKLMYSARKDSDGGGGTPGGSKYSTDTESIGSSEANQGSSRKSSIGSGSHLPFSSRKNTTSNAHPSGVKTKNKESSAKDPRLYSQPSNLSQSNDESENIADVSKDGEGVLKKTSLTFDFDMNLDEMKGIVKSPNEVEPSDVKGGEHDLVNRSSAGDTRQDDDADVKRTFLFSKNNHSASGVWKAPDSWEVKPENPNKSRQRGTTLSESDSDEKEQELSFGKPSDTVESHPAVQKRENLSKEGDDMQKREVSPEGERKHSLAHRVWNNKWPVLYGSLNATNDYFKYLTKGPNHIIRIFKEDNTFTTILCPLETTTTELLTIVQKKFFLDSLSNYRISVYVGNSVKVLDSLEKPLKIQMGLFLLSGYSTSDNLNIIGREDLSFLCKFVLENIYLRSLTHEEEHILSRDYVDINISGLDLKNIPVIFHKHTYEIERLNVANNPSLYIPLDFVESCINLNTIIFAQNGCSRFPTNFLQSKKLKYLDLQKNYLDELPAKIGTLRNLTVLNLNSNQLSYLPKSLGKLENLETLNLSSNYFVDYPHVINELVNLKYLDLSYNDLMVIPESIGKLLSLIELNFSTNKLDKELPITFKDLVSLQKLDLRYNNLANIDVLGLLPRLQVAYLSKNKFSHFSQGFNSLNIVHLDRNPITNLQAKNSLPNLKILNLNKAKITAISADFITSIPRVEKLILDKNHIVNLPSEIGSLKNLAYLSIYSNNLNALPSNIDELVSLKYLDVHSNNLQTLPEGIWSLGSLSFLNASSNILTSFPKPPRKLSAQVLSTMNFGSLISNSSQSIYPRSRHSSENDLSDDGKKYRDKDQEQHNVNELDDFRNNSGVRSSLCSSLISLSLADNRLGDDSFESISLLLELRTLNLSYNDFIEIPEGALRRFGHLSDLYLSGNELSQLPADDLENLKSLTLLFLNNNKFVSLPGEISKLSNLRNLDVGSNQLKYNISNVPYDWNWQSNRNLKYLNFSGNRRFEIKQTFTKNPDTGEDFDSLLVLKNLKVLGLIDVTITSPYVPDHSFELRIRTTASELENVGYGVADSMGMREHVSNRDIFIQKFRGNEDEVLLCAFDGKRGTVDHSHRVSGIAKSLFVPTFTEELNKIRKDEDIRDAIRKTFLAMNKYINGVLASKKKNNNHTPLNLPMAELDDLNLIDDAKAGCTVGIMYMKGKKLYVANTGDLEVLLSRNNGEHVLLSQRHHPTCRDEFERIRAAGGYVTGDGALDGDLTVSRGFGFFNYLPHTHAGPDITEIELTSLDDIIIIGTGVLWEHISYQLASDISRQEKGDPMIAAQKLRDFAISYGTTDKISVSVITLGEGNPNRSKFGSNLYNNLARESDLLTNKKRRDRAQLSTVDNSIRKLEEEIEPPEGQLALVFTDIKNSTLLWDAYPVAMRSAIKIHNQVMRRQMRIVGGYEVKTEGDAFIVSFPSPTAALIWCFTVQRQLLTQDWPSEILDTPQCCEVKDNKGRLIYRGLSVRMGINWGAPVCELDFVTKRMDYFGPMVNRTARISSVADGGQISVSSDFLAEMKRLYEIHWKVLQDKVSIEEAYFGNVAAGNVIEKEINFLEEEGFSYFELGEMRLKGLETPEVITLVYPKSLEMRFDIFKNSLSPTENMFTSTKKIGYLSEGVLNHMRALSLRLERLCNTTSSGEFTGEYFARSSMGSGSTKVISALSERDAVNYLEHLVTRVENAVLALYLRQKLKKLSGQDNRIDFYELHSLAELLSDIDRLFALYELQKAKNA